MDKQFSYRERDFTYARAMLGLRTALNLTQIGLAEVLGVSRRTVSAWEAGSKYPKPDNLKQLITLAIKQQAFPAGRENEEIRMLWQLTNQKVLLDETWLTSLLAQMDLSLTQPISPPLNRLQTGQPSANGPRVNWDEALSVRTFYGREWELNLLAEWVLKDDCRVVSVVGLGGIGKSSLAVSLMQQVAPGFEVVIWRSLRDAPSCEVLMQGCFQVLAPQVLDTVSGNLERRISLLLDYLRSMRVLLVLDNMEVLLAEGERTGHLRPEYADYTQLLLRLSETQHQSCIVLTSREKLIDLLPLEGNRAPVRTLRLARLEPKACHQLLTDRGLSGTLPEMTQLVDAYAGNPLALKIVAQTIIDLFQGAIGPFLQQGEVIFGGIRELLAEQFTRLSTLEETVLLWLAILREPSTLDELLDVLETPAPRGLLLEAVGALHRRSLIERGQKQGSFVLQSVVLEYATALLITQAGNELRQGGLARLVLHGLTLAQSREFVRQTQERLIMNPILEQLVGNHQPQAGIEQQFLALLDALRAQPSQAQGYGPANILKLLLMLRGHLRGLNLSHLTLRGLYLQGVELQDTNLSGAVIQDCIFTETFDAVQTVTIGGTGEFWAATTVQAEVRAWRVVGQALLPLWQNGSAIAYRSSASPDGRVLACGCGDGTIKLFDFSNGTLLWVAKSSSSTIIHIEFSPDSSKIVSSGDRSIEVWDRYTGQLLQTIPSVAEVPAATWSPDGQVLAVSDMESRIWLWKLPENDPAICLGKLEGHTQIITGLVFAPDGRTLASASWDGTLKLWDVSERNLRQTLVAGGNDKLAKVAWSPDGRLVACIGTDKAIWLWDVEMGDYRAVLQGHTEYVRAIAFTPDNRSLLSGAHDSTVRIWDTANGQCIRIVRGYTLALFDVDWSPDSTRLVSGSSDKSMTIWDVASGSALNQHNLRGVVYGVAWSPDGDYVASTAWNSAIWLWDPTTGECLETIEYPGDLGNRFWNLTWSRDSQWLACVTSRHGVLMWHLATRQPHWLQDPFPTVLSNVAISPDSRRVACSGANGLVYVWDVQEERLIQQLDGGFNTYPHIAWNGDGTRVALSGPRENSDSISIWDIQSGEQVSCIEAHPGRISTMVWDSSQDQIICASFDGRLSWWDVKSSECLRTLKGHTGSIPALRLSPDKTRLAGCADDGSIKLWDLQTGAYLKTIRRDRLYERLNITGVQGLTGGQAATLRVLGALEDGMVSV